MRLKIAELQKDKTFRDEHQRWLADGHTQLVIGALKNWSCEPKVLQYEASAEAVHRAYGEGQGLNSAIFLMENMGIEPPDDKQEPEATFGADLKEKKQQTGK